MANLPAMCAPPPEPDARQCYVTVHVYETDFDSEDDARFFDNNDLANRIWEDNELFQDN